MDGVWGRAPYCGGDWAEVWGYRGCACDGLCGFCEVGF